MNKVLQITAMVNIGSVGRIAESIGRLSINDGWKSYIAYGRGAGKSRSELIKIGSNTDKYIHGMLTRFYDRHGAGSYFATKRLIRKIDEIKPDIIHLHNLHGYYINLKVLFDYLGSACIPVVWTLHDCWTVTGHCVHFENINCIKWMDGCYDCPGTKGYPASWLVDNSKVNFQIKKELFNSVENLTLVPVCNWLSNIISKSHLSGKSKRIIYNGIDTEVFKPRELNAGFAEKLLPLKEKFIILAVASAWNDTKGINDILSLAQILNDGYHIVVVGLSRKQIRRLPPNITGIERVDNVIQLAGIYSFADVFINPTYQDTLPTVTIESIACGTPVVIYNTGGSADIVSDKTGTIVETGNIDAFKKAVEEICRCGKSRYRNDCREYAVRMFNEDNNFTSYINLYHSLIDNR